MEETGLKQSTHTTISNITALLGIFLLLVFLARRVDQQNTSYQNQIQNLREEIVILRAEHQKIFHALQEMRAERMSMAATVLYRGQSFDTYIVDIEKSDLRLFLRDTSKQGLQTFEALRSHVAIDTGRLVFATNAGMFDPDHQPVGLYVENGEELYPLNLQEGAGNFYMKPNGIFRITTTGASVIESSDYLNYFDSTLFATQSGPLLLLNDTIHPAFRDGSTNTFIRSGVGIISEQKIVLAISKEAVNFFDFAMLFKEYFGCSDALYLDGAISEMFLPALNRTEMIGNFGPFLGIVE